MASRFPLRYRCCEHGTLDNLPALAKLPYALWGRLIPGILVSSQKPNDANQGRPSGRPFEFAGYLVLFDKDSTRFISHSMSFRA